MAARRWRLPALFTQCGRAQQVVDRRFNPARHGADQTIAAFAARRQDTLNLDSVCDGPAGVPHQALEPAHVSMWISHRG